MEIRRLEPSDDRTGFDSGQIELDAFFRLYAGQNQFRYHIGVTYVAVDGKQIRGYLTLSAGSVEFDRIKSAIRRTLPRYPLPTLRIARLAVELGSRSIRVGERLLKHAITMAVRMRDDYGCVGLIVDAKPDSVSFYVKYGFDRIRPVAGLIRGESSTVAMFLPIETAVEALGAQD